MLDATYRRFWPDGKHSFLTGHPYFSTAPVVHCSTAIDMWVTVRLEIEYGWYSPVIELNEKAPVCRNRSEHFLHWGGSNITTQAVARRQRPWGTCPQFDKGGVRRSEHGSENGNGKPYYTGNQKDRKGDDSRNRRVRWTGQTQSVLPKSQKGDNGGELTADPHIRHAAPMATGSSRQSYRLDTPQPRESTTFTHHFPILLPCKPGVLMEHPRGSPSGPAPAPGKSMSSGWKSAPASD